MLNFPLFPGVGGGGGGGGDSQLTSAAHVSLYPKRASLIKLLFLRS